MAPVTLPAHTPARPPVVSQQEAGEDRRARWWAGRGRGHCGRHRQVECMQDSARVRCKTHSTSRQHKGGGGRRGRGQGGRDRTKPQATRTRTHTRKPEKPEPTKRRTNKPFGLRKNKKPNQKTPGGESHAGHRRSMKEKNVPKWTVMSSVVPETKTRETK